MVLRLGAPDRVAVAIPADFSGIDRPAETRKPAGRPGQRIIEGAGGRVIKQIVVIVTTASRKNFPGSAAENVGIWVSFRGPRPAKIQPTGHFGDLKYNQQVTIVRLWACSRLRPARLPRPRRRHCMSKTPLCIKVWWL